MENNIAHKPISSASTSESARIEIVQKCFNDRHLPLKLKKHILEEITGREVNCTPVKYIDICKEWVLKNEGSYLLPPPYTIKTTTEDLIFFKGCLQTKHSDYVKAYKDSCNNPFTYITGLEDGSIFTDGDYLLEVRARVIKEELIGLEGLIALKETGLPQFKREFNDSREIKE